MAAGSGKDKDADKKNDKPVKYTKEMRAAVEEVLRKRGCKLLAEETTAKATKICEDMKKQTDRLDDMSLLAGIRAYSRGADILAACRMSQTLVEHEHRKIQEMLASIQKKIVDLPGFAEADAEASALYSEIGESEIWKKFLGGTKTGSTYSGK